MEGIYFILKLTKEKDKLSRTDHVVCKALMNGMSPEDIYELKNHHQIDWYLENLATELLANKHQKKSVPCHNRRWQDYFNDMTNNNVGRIAESRKKLHDIFPYLEWTAQNKIIIFSLTNKKKTDRVWALKEIYDNWSLFGKKNIEKYSLLSLWEQYHDKQMARIIVKNLPVNIVQKYADSLIEVLDYQSVALRLGENSSFEIDHTRLTDVEFLYIMTKLGRRVSEEIANKILILTIVNGIFFKNYLLTEEVPMFTMMSIPSVSLVIWCMGKMRMSRQIIEFYENDRDIQKALHESWNRITDKSKIDYWPWFCHNIKPYLHNFGPLINDVLDIMVLKNQKIKMLIEKLQLEHVVK